VFVGSGLDRAELSMKWNDDAEADKIIYALNHGEYQKKAA